MPKGATFSESNESTCSVCCFRIRFCCESIGSKHGISSCLLSVCLTLSLYFLPIVGFLLLGVSSAFAFSSPVVSLSQGRTLLPQVGYPMFFALVFSCSAGLVFLFSSLVIVCCIIPSLSTPRSSRSDKSVVSDDVSLPPFRFLFFEDCEADSDSRDEDQEPYLIRQLASFTAMCLIFAFRGTCSLLIYLLSLPPYPIPSTSLLALSLVSTLLSTLVFVPSLVCGIADNIQFLQEEKADSPIGVVRVVGHLLTPCFSVLVCVCLFLSEIVWLFYGWQLDYAPYDCLPVGILLSLILILVLLTVIGAGCQSTCEEKLAESIPIWFCFPCLVAFSVFSLILLPFPAAVILTCLTCCRFDLGWIFEELRQYLVLGFVTIALPVVYIICSLVSFYQDTTNPFCLILACFASSWAISHLLSSLSVIGCSCVKWQRSLGGETKFNTMINEVKVKSYQENRRRLKEREREKRRKKKERDEQLRIQAEEREEKRRQKEEQREEKRRLKEEQREEKRLLKEAMKQQKEDERRERIRKQRQMEQFCVTIGDGLYYYIIDPRDKEARLGSGSFGSVFKGYLTDNPEKVFAIKRIENSPANGVDELRMLLQCDHSNIVKTYGLFVDGDWFYLVMELCSKGSFRKLLDSNVDEDGFRTGLTDDEVRCYLSQIVSGVHYLHSLDILHRDIKPANIVISEDGTLKLCDFGLARFYSTDATMKTMTVCGTPQYLAPEIRLAFEQQRGGVRYSESADVYSIGAILYEMIHNLEYGLAVNRQNVRPATNSLERLCLRMVDADPYSRPSTEEILDFLVNGERRVTPVAPEDSEVIEVTEGAENEDV